MCGEIQEEQGKWLIDDPGGNERQLWRHQRNHLGTDQIGAGEVIVDHVAIRLYKVLGLLYDAPKAN